jgi:protein TonB
MRPRTLFTASLGLSIAVHALLLFAPSWSTNMTSKPEESYRVSLNRRSIGSTDSGAAATAANASVPRDPPKPAPDSLAIPQVQALAEDPAKPPATIEELEERSREPEPMETREEPEPTVNGRGNPRLAESTVPRGGGQPRGTVAAPPNDYQRILGELNRMLREQLRYPEVARRKGIEGAVAITLTLDSDGKATNVVVARSSGSRILDRAAVQAISQIFPYPDPPEDSLHFTIPVTYRLTE